MMRRSAIGKPNLSTPAAIADNVSFAGWSSLTSMDSRQYCSVSRESAIPFGG
jgi:hypothetical protein